MAAVARKVERSPERLHRATYATDKRKGGYMIRVAGPQAGRFAGRVVPVTRKDGSESEEALVKLTWSGKDDETGENVALYTFEPRPREEVDEIPF